VLLQMDGNATNQVLTYYDAYCLPIA
jgi:hypothetical protein